MVFLALSIVRRDRPGPSPLGCCAGSFLMRRNLTGKDEAPNQRIKIEVLAVRSVAGANG